MRRGLIGSVGFLFLTCAMLLGDPPPRDGTANGQIYWKNEGGLNPSPTVDGKTGTITGEGTAAVDAGWGIDSITLFAIPNTGGYVYNATATGGTGGWTASIANLPPSNYEVWAYMHISQNGQNAQLVCTPLATTMVMNQKMPPPTHPNTGNQVFWDSGQPTRGPVWMHGKGTFNLGTGWSVQHLSMYVHPSIGGRVNMSNFPAATAGSANPFTWADSTSFDPLVKYDAYAFMNVKNNQNATQSYASNFVRGK